MPGYYSQAGYNSNASLVAYRVNTDSSSASYNKLERMGKGFPLNGAYTTSMPVVFIDGSTNTTIQGAWPAACYPSCSSDPTYRTDPDYETAGPQVFRFEYYYLLSSNPSLGATYANQLSAGPWASIDTFSVKDVAAIVVAMAVIEPKSRVLLSNDQIATLAGRLTDFTTGWTPGQLLTQWQNKLNGIIDPDSPDYDPTLPRAAISSIRMYERYFYLSQ